MSSMSSKVMNYKILLPMDMKKTKTMKRFCMSFDLGDDQMMQRTGFHSLKLK